MNTPNDMKVVLKLKPVLDLGAAEEFIATIRQHAETADKLHLDASEVRAVTTPCIQIILAAIKSNSSVAVASPSPEFSGAFTDLGLTFPLAAPIELPACGPDEAPSIQPTQESDAPETSLPILDQTEAQAMAKRILTIDDSKTIRDMLRMTLVDAGYEVLQAIDGQEGVEMLDSEQVDLVITDINMPKMNGYDVVRQLRSNPIHKGLPILVLTTESDSDKKNIAREAGATGWMVKPFDPDRLVATVRKVIP